MENMGRSSWRVEENNGDNYLILKVGNRRLASISSKELEKYISKLYGRGLEQLVESKMEDLNLTPNQRDIVLYIDDFRKSNGVSPTYQEIANNFNKSKVSIYGAVERIEKKGALKKVYRSPRSITLAIKIL